MVNRSFRILEQFTDQSEGGKNDQVENNPGNPVSAVKAW